MKKNNYKYLLNKKNVFVNYINGILFLCLNALIGILHFYDQSDSLFDERKWHLINYPRLAEELHKAIDDYEKNVLSVMDKDLNLLSHAWKNRE